VVFGVGEDLGEETAVRVRWEVLFGHGVLPVGM
jgi:hypothetical protein